MTSPAEIRRLNAEIERLYQQGRDEDARTLEIVADYKARRILERKDVTR
jgi:hypothetical protein